MLCTVVGVWVHLLGFQVRDRVILVVCECIWNALLVLLGLPTFYDTGSLCYPSHWVAYQPSDSTLMTASRFPAGNREAKLKPTTFSSLLLFSVFCFYSSPTPQRYNALIANCWGYSLIIIIYVYIIIIIKE